MLAAFQGVEGLYINLNSDDKIWQVTDGPTEYDLGKNIVDAAVQAGVKHLVFSSGAPCVEMTGGVVNLKAMESPLGFASTAYDFASLRPSLPSILHNIWKIFRTKQVAPVFGGFPHFPDEEAFLTFRVPHWGGDNLVPFLSVRDDYGDIVHGIFLDPSRWRGHVIHGASDMVSFAQLTADFEEVVTGRSSRFKPVLSSWEAFDTHGVPELEDVKLMFGFTQVTGGRYFAPEPSEISNAAILKRATAQALGRSEKEQRLISVKEWFRKNFVV